jgi:hypothetical protein
MRPTGSTHARGRRQSGVSISLFPFLAVLICTMGALILLLVVIARHARLQAAQTHAVAAARRAKDLKEAKEDTEWRTGELEISRQKTQQQLAEARLILGHLEDHNRRLREQLARLKASLDNLDRTGSDGSQQRDKLLSESARLKAAIAEAEDRLADAQKEAARRQHSFAVVPYRGPHETYRRPIYIECRADSVVLQPEGIVLTEDDFDGPMGPGNPLAAAFRATREYLLSQGQFDGEQSAEPYPLLLVRPEGIMAYYAARDALESWASEFGYELIGEDWELDFPPPDPQLAQVVRRALDTARVRQQRLAAAAPRRYSGSQRKEYTVSRARGGVVPYGDSLGSEEAEPSGWGPPGASGGQFAGGGGDASAPTLQSHSNGSGTAKPMGRHAGSTPAGPPPPDLVAGRPPKEQQPSSRSDPGTPLRPGEWQPRSPAAAGGHAGPPRPGAEASSLAKTRGRGWALPDAAHGSVPITRPIRVQCLADRLVILSEDGRAEAKSIQLGPRNEDSIDQFISAVWEHMEDWGIAGKGMYWRPVLNVHVAPDAQQRFATLSALLEDSGLEVQRR